MFFKFRPRHHLLDKILAGWRFAAGSIGNVSFLRTDHIGRPVLATDALGAVASTISHKPFGEVHTSTGLDTGLRFPGQVYHWESELHQNWMRDYDPTTGRYIQADPLGLVDGASVYGYVMQSPGRYTDPRGEQTYGPDLPFLGVGPLPNADHEVSKEWQDPPHSVPREYETEICTLGVPCGTGIDWRFGGFYQMYCLPGKRQSTTNVGQVREGGYEVGVVTNMLTGQQTVTHRFFNRRNDCSTCAFRQLTGPFSSSFHGYSE